MATPSHCFVPLSPVTFLERSGRAFPTRQAVTYSGRSVTFSQLLSRTRRLTQVLRDLGISNGDCVGFLSENKLQSIEVHFAIPASGGILVSMNPWLPSADIADQIAFTSAKVLIASDKFVNRHPDLFATASTLQHVIVIDSQASTTTGVVNQLDYNTAVEQADDAIPLDRYIQSELDPVVINFTSGTTGRPKGVMISHRAAYLHAMGQVLMLEMNGASRYLWSLPMFHVNGWGHMWASVVIGAQQFISQSDGTPGSEVNFVKEIEQYQATHLAGAPRLVRALVDTAEGNALAGLTIITGGAAPQPVLIKELENIGIKLVHQYGLNETLGPYVVCEEQHEWQDMSQDERTQKRMRQGVPTIHAGTGLRVVDENGDDVAANGTTMGEIIMAGNTVATAYYNNEEASAKSFIDGWFRSGDMAVVYADGYIEIKDRIKDLIYVETEYGWENISSIEVENTIGHHEAVKDVAVIGVSVKQADSDKEAPLLIAFLEAQPGKTVTEAQLHQYCESELAAYKRPHHFFFDELPKTATGKVKKDILGTMARERLAKM